jgi:hypothetical protein
MGRHSLASSFHFKSISEKPAEQPLEMLLISAFLNALKYISCTYM